MLEYQIYEWLKLQGIAVPEYKVFGLNEVFDVDFFPVALKLCSEKIVHKTEAGAVALNIFDKQALEIARNKMITHISAAGIVPDTADKFLITRMYEGIELFFGIINDRCFGRVVLFGVGGIYAELLRDICYIDSEAEEQEIINAIAQTKISDLFTKGFRGKKYNLQAVVSFIKKLQQLDVEEMDLNPVILSEAGLTVVDARMRNTEKQADPRPVKYIPDMFKPGKTAIIGVSANENKIGYALAKNSAQNDGVYFVNTTLQELFSKKIYNNIKGLPEINTGIIAVSAEQVKDIIEQLASLKVKNIVIISAGFKEAGRDESFLEQLSKQYQINIIGPNCIGVYLAGVNLTFASNTINSGNTNLFSQSGALISELVDMAATKNIGFENIISVGNMADIDFADLISSYMGTNPLNLYIEGINRGKNLLRAIRKSTNPIRIFKAGRTAVAEKAAFSHTGNLAGNYEMFTGLVKAAGAELLNDVTGLLYHYHFKKVIVITNAGGAGTIICDLIGEYLYLLSDEQIKKLDKVLPRHWSKNNPIDIIGDASYQRYLGAITVADKFGADAIYVVITPQFMTHAEKICSIFTADSFKTLLLPVLLGGEAMEAAKTYLKSENIIFFESIQEAVSFLPPASSRKAH